MGPAGGSTGPTAVAPPIGASGVPNPYPGVNSGGAAVPGVGAMPGRPPGPGSSGASCCPGVALVEGAGEIPGKTPGAGPKGDTCCSGARGAGEMLGKTPGRTPNGDAGGGVTAGGGAVDVVAGDGSEGGASGISSGAAAGRLIVWATTGHPTRTASKPKPMHPACGLGLALRRRLAGVNPLPPWLPVCRDDSSTNRSQNAHSTRPAPC